MKKAFILFYFASLQLISFGADTKKPNFKNLTELTSQMNRLIIGLPILNQQISELQLAYDSEPIYFLFPIQKNSSKQKIIAVTLAVTLGVFGVHRLYLGTSTKVPIIYTLTLGGGFGILVISDIIAIISSKDLALYSPNEQVFMWAE